MSDAQDMIDAAVLSASGPPTTVVLRFPFTITHRPVSLPLYEDDEIVAVDRKPGDDATTVNLWVARRTDVIRPAVLPARWFAVRGTGDPITGDAQHVGTWQEGMYVWHLFQVPAPEPS